MIDAELALIIFCGVVFGALAVMAATEFFDERRRARQGHPASYFMAAWLGVLAAVQCAGAVLLVLVLAR